MMTTMLGFSSAAPSAGMENKKQVRKMVISGFTANSPIWLVADSGEPCDGGWAWRFGTLEVHNRLKTNNTRPSTAILRRALCRPAIVDLNIVRLPIVVAKSRAQITNQGHDQVGDVAPIYRIPATAMYSKLEVSGFTCLRSTLHAIVDFGAEADMPGEPQPNGGLENGT